MSERSPRPIKAPMITRPGESNEHFGTRNISNFLPEIFQTQVNRQFLDTTMEQLLSSGSLQPIRNYIGQQYLKNTVADNYIIDDRSNDTYQFTPGLVNKDPDQNIQGAMPYDDLINAMKFNEVDVNNHNKTLNETAYTLDLPINYDMFINYHKYFWLTDILPPCSLSAVLANPIDIDTIIGRTSYTTPTLVNGKTLALQNGMRIRFTQSQFTEFTQTVSGNTTFTVGAYSNTVKVFKNNLIQTVTTDYTYNTNTGVITFTTAPAINDVIRVTNFHSYSTSGNYEVDSIYIVDGVGTGIKLTKQYEATRYNHYARHFINTAIYDTQNRNDFVETPTTFSFDPTDTDQYKNTKRDYVVEERWAADHSAWARSNLWIHEDSAQAMCAYQGLTASDYIVDTFRAVRPIIEYKAGIEKYNFGKNHISYVDHLVEDNIDPATAIVGQTDWDWTISGITTQWSSGSGYEPGDLVYLSVNSNITYYECIAKHTDPKDPSQSQNYNFWKRIVPQALQNNDIVMFLQTTNSVYNNKIFRVSGVGTSIVLTEIYGSGSTAINTNDKVVVINGHNSMKFGTTNESSEPYDGSEWYWNGSAWIYGQQKTARSFGMLAQLYDINNVKLDNTATYPNSNFKGGYIFDYVHNTANPVDDALGFGVDYVDYGNSPGINFSVDLVNKKFKYTQSSPNTEKSLTRSITGYYYYKMLDGTAHNGWVTIRNSQPVKRVVRKTITKATAGQTLKFDLGHNSFDKDKYFVFTKTSDDKLRVSSQKDSSLTNRLNPINGTLPTLFMNTGTTYTFQTQFAQNQIEFVDFDGTALGSGFTRSAGTGDVFTFAIATPSQTAIKYRVVGTTNKEGIIYINTVSDYTNITVYRNRTKISAYSLSGNILSITGASAIDDIYEVEYYTEADYSDTVEGSQLIADTQTHNAQNLDFANISFGDLVEHVRQQMTGIPGFTGDYFGINNYRQLPHVHEFGGTIRQQPYSTELVSQLLMDKDTNPYSSVKFNANQYSMFKKQFKLKVAQLHNTLDITQSVYTLVDRALEAMFVGKNKSTLFANSNMAMYRDYESADYGWNNPTTPVFDLPESVNTYDDEQNHIQVWLNDDDGAGNTRWRALIKDQDYTLGSNKITVTTNPTFPSGGQAQLHVRWYPRASVSFVPPSAVKLGLCKSYLPELRSDYSKDSTGTATDTVIVGHDGSVHVRNGTELYDRSKAGFDPVDAALWDLECRIYNNIQHAKLDNVKSIKTYTPNAHRANVYTWNKFQDTVKSEFNKWKVANNVTALQSDTYYDASDKWTWNYSDVTPGIGGWRGLYHYFFNTDRPHTHPWEMMGYNRKPSWWDANYSWTDATERANLITALKYGKINNPALNAVYDINYSYNNYDWATNTLVTNAGVLNDPDTAGVVATPTDPARAFEFGDWGPVEAEWRRSAEYKIVEFLALLKARPLIATNNYFAVNERKESTLSSFDNAQLYNGTANQLTSWKSHQLSGNVQTGKIIEAVRVVNGGTGYTSAPVVSVYDNFGQDAQIETHITGGVVTSVSVINPGKNYYNRPTLVVGTGAAKLEPILAEDSQRYFIGMQNSITDFAKSNSTTVEDLQTRLENMSFSTVAKAGGFVNSNQKFMLESSQGKGRVFIPEENFNTILFTNSPSTEYFFGGIKIDKTANGYKIAGYDNSKLTFKYYAPVTSSNKISAVISSTEVFRYTDFETTESTLDYNTELSSIQEVYNFIVGYGYYLNKIGFTQQWRSAANDFVTWAASETTIQLKIIPDNTKITVQDSTNGYFDNINNRYDGIYNVNDSNGNQIQTSKLLIDRNILSLDKETTFSVKDSSDEIYGVRLYKTQVEHLIVFDNITNFDDVVYDPAIGQRHNRIVWQGTRTKDWNGRFYSPGFVITDNTIIPNYDTVAKELDQYYGRTTNLSNSQISNVAKYNSGYNKPQWADNLDIDDDTLFEFVQGSLKYKGTKYALDAFARNKSLFDADATIDLHEEWAIRIADFGDTRSRDTIEFQLTPDLLTTSPQSIRFTQGELNDTLTDLTIDVDSNSPLLVTGSPGNNFTTRAVNTYSGSTTDEYHSDFVNSGLPLTTETDYQVINRQDMLSLVENSSDTYDFGGDWRDVLPWDPYVSYKYNDKVLHEGRSWAMLDPDGSSGISTGNDPIEVIGTITLPTVPASGGTLVLDNTTVTLSKTSTTTTLGVINIIGTQDIASSNVVTHGSTVVLGETSALAQTITFSNPVTTTTYNDVVKTGTVSNPNFVGSATKTLIIDGQTVTFNDTVATTTNITAQAALENSFNANSFNNAASLATNRINAIEALRTAYISASSSSAWQTFITTYFTSNAGINLSQLLVEHGTSPSYTTQLESLITNDVALINEQTGNSYVASAVISGSTVIPNSDILATQNAVDNGVYIDDFATYVKGNPSVTLATTTVVATQSGTTFKTYTLAGIVQEINDAGIPNVVATNTGTFLRLTKTTSTPTVAFDLTLSVGTANNDVGFSTQTETIAATSSTSTGFPNLTLQQTVNQINAAGITGITASINANNTNLLQINSNRATLYIGNGTANSVIGITPGVTPAGSTTTTSNTSLDVNDIVDKINQAGISGVSASNSNNRLKLVSVNSQFVIGAGSSNGQVGLVAQTYNSATVQVGNVFNAIVGSDSNQVFREMTNDPNIFSIHIADDSVESNYNLGYQVYQTMDLSMYVNYSCAGIIDADEAEITVARYPSNLTQAHNLSVGDYVLIRGSTTIPSIDGIHRVHKVDSDNTNKFYIDQYITQEGSGGNIYPLRPVRFSTFNELDSVKNNQVNGVYKYNFGGFRQNNTAQPIYAYVDNDGTNKSAVYKWSGLWTNANGHYNGVFEKVRTGNTQARNDLIENVKIYDALNRSSIANIETWDPAKGIIFGFVDKEINYKLASDIASYNYNSIDGEITNTSSWTEEYVGVRWWDISTAIYLDYEQSTIDYQQMNWGRLAAGASIDIYEWTRSPVLPEQWQDAVNAETVIDGNVASGEAYFTVVDNERIYNWTEQVYYNPRTRRNETVYYFWVKNKLSFSGIRQYNVTQLSQILANPEAFGLSWAAASGSSQLFLSNVSNYVTKYSVVQINQRYPDSNSMPLNEWTLLAENDPNTTIPEYLHIKMRDSLTGFNNYSIDSTYTTWGSSTVYAKDAVVKEGNDYYISLQSNNQSQQPSLDTDMSHWSKIYDYSFVDGTQVDDIRIWRGQHVPDLDLHEYNRYGHLVRPRQSLFRDLVEARHNFVYTVNDMLSQVNVVDELQNWEDTFETTFTRGAVTYDVKDYVNLTDFKLIEKNSAGTVTYRFDTNTVPDFVYDSDQEYLNAGEPPEGSYVLIKHDLGSDLVDRKKMYHFVGGTDKLVFKEKSTVQLSEEMWLQSKFGHGFDSMSYDLMPFDSDSSIVIGHLMDLLRKNVFVGRHHVMYNKLWFKLLYSAVLQNTTDDFAFKTTYVRLRVNHPLLLNKSTYQRFGVDVVEKYFDTIKPFHTKLLDLVDSNTHGEATNIQIDEQSRNTDITIVYGDHTLRDWACDQVLLGGDFTSTPTGNEDISTFTTLDANLDYIYNGNLFDQPACEGWGEELYPTDFVENISIAVQTNASGSTETADTRTYRMTQYQPMDIHISNVIVDANKTTTTANVSGTDTIIPVTNAALLDNPNTVFGKGEVPCVVYIDGERIEYNAISGNNLLFCIRGTLGTSAKAHNSGATVINSGPTTRIPTLEKFSDHGDNLRMAYNDSGVSLSAAGISPEHAFIRNAGQGSI